MKKFVTPLLLLSAVVLTSGCITHNSNTASAPLHVNLVANDLKADVAVGEKISGQAKLTTLFWIFTFGGSGKYADGVSYDGVSTQAGGGDFFSSLMSAAQMAGFNQIKSSAAFDAISKSNADVIISPRYVLDVEDYGIFKTVEAKVTGYKGTVKSIR